MTKERDAIVKVSGDVVEKDELLQILARLAKKSRLFIVCGGRTSINKKLDEMHIRYYFDKKNRRIIPSEEGREIASQVLQEKSRLLSNRLISARIKVAWVGPSLLSLGVIKNCHVDGDDLFAMVAADQSFVRRIVITAEGRDKSDLEERIKEDTGKKLEIIKI